MGERVHFWADIPNDWRASSKGDAEHHSEKDGTSTQVKSTENLKSIFRSMLSLKAVMDLADFHTHGGPGSINLGAGSLHYNNVDSELGNQKFENLFSTGASVIFTGCNVAESYAGELFLVKIGQVLLKKSGGKVMGSTGFGLADPLFTGEVFHPTGNWVSANVGAGGGVTLSGHTYLIPEKIRERIKKVSSRLYNVSFDPKTASFIQTARENLDKATEQVPAEGNTPSYPAMFNAWFYLEKAETNLALAESVNRVQTRGPKL